VGGVWLCVPPNIVIIDRRYARENILVIGTPAWGWVATTGRWV
jgi:hypothetical protein